MHSILEKAITSLKDKASDISSFNEPVEDEIYVPDVDYETIKFVNVAKAYYDVLECRLIERMPNFIEVLKNDTKELIKYQSQELIYNAAFKEYYSNIDTTRFDDNDLKVRAHLKNPKNLDIDNLRYETTMELVYEYKPYWEWAISQLKRSNAILNRRKYLVNQINTILPTISIYPDLEKEMKDYLLFNESIINADK